MIGMFFYKKETIYTLDHEGFTQLMQACYKGNIDKVKGQLFFDANVNFQDTQDGFTPLYTATAGNKIEIVKLLLEEGANPQIKEHRGITPLMIAQKHGFTEIAEILEAHIAKKSDTNK